MGYSPEHGIYVVCDGMGGAAAGEVASAMAVEEALKRLCPPDGPMPRALEDAVRSANGAVYAKALLCSEFRGMGTTLVALAVKENRAWVTNVGDSRCYRLRDGRLRQITRDHSLVEELVRMGEMTPDQAAHSPLRNRITRAIGIEDAVVPESFALEVEPGDLFLLCSDGLSNELPNTTMEFHLRQEGSLAELCARLVHEAIVAGGNDNITCILVRAAAE